MPASLNLMFVILLSLLAACGKGDKTTTAFEVSNLAFAASNDQDALLYGQHLNSKITFSKLITTGNAEMDLPSGEWLFAVVAWDRADATLEGKTRCKILPKVSLNGGFVPLSFEISTEGCKNFFFGKGNFLHSASGEFQEVTFKACTDLTTATGPGVSCSSPAGYSGYTVTAIEYLLGPAGNPLQGAESLISGCSIPSTSFRLPVFSALPLAFKVRAYSDVTCTNLQKEIVFKKGVQEIPGMTRVFDNVNTTEIYISDAPVPSIVAKNTSQTSGYVSQNGLAPLANIVRTITFIQPNHYSGNLAVNCGFTFSSPINSIGSCSCNANGACTASVNITNPSSTEFLKDVVFGYTLTDGTETSNAANAKMCMSNTCTPL